MIYKAFMKHEPEITFESSSVLSAKRTALEELEPSAYAGTLITLVQYELSSTGVWPTGRVWTRKAHHKRGWIEASK